MTGGGVALPFATWCMFSHDYPSRFGAGVANWVAALMNEKGWFTTGLSQLGLTFVQLGPYVPSHVGNGVVIRDGSDGKSARWDANLAELPKRRFARKKRQLTITLRGDPALDFLTRDHLNDVSAKHIQIGAAMVQQALVFAQSTFMPLDKVDLSPLIAAAGELAAHDWASDDAMRTELRAAYALDRARIDAMDPWAKIDMRGFHADARKILDDPSDWSAVNDFSPHGNDLGADILGDWPKLKNKSVAAVAAFFGIDISAGTAEASMARIQILQGLAFGHLKKSGRCPEDLTLQTLHALRTEREIAAEMIRPEHLAGWVAACDRYIQIMERTAGRSA